MARASVLRDLRRFGTLSCLVFLALGLANPGPAQESTRLPIEKVRDRFSGKVVTDWDMAYEMIAFRQPNAPRVGEKAPTFTLDLLGEESRKLSLADLHREKPVVLIFSSWGCDIFRESLGGLQALHTRFQSDVQFAMVYVREAHPSNGFGSAMGRVEDRNTIEDREATAERCRLQLRLPFPVLVDPIDDPVSTRWAAFPIRLFVVDTDGTVAFAGPVGPWGYRPYRGFQHGDGELVGWDLQFSRETLEEFLETRFPAPAVPTGQPAQSPVPAQSRGQAGGS